MSLLLDALKKAANAKCRQEEERINQRTGQRPPTVARRSGGRLWAKTVSIRNVSPTLCSTVRRLSPASKCVERCSFSVPQSRCWEFLRWAAIPTISNATIVLRAQFADVRSARQQTVEPENQAPPERSEPLDTADRRRNWRRKHRRNRLLRPVPSWPVKRRLPRPRHNGESRRCRVPRRRR